MIKKTFANFKFKWDKECIFFATLLLIFLIGTFKYIANGETYIFSTPSVADNMIALNENIISQEIIIDEKALWNNKSYSVYFSFEKKEDMEGHIRLELTQNGVTVDTYDLPASWLKNEFNELKWLKFSKLKAGKATVILKGVNLNYPIYAELCDNVYNIPNCYLNNADSGYTLVQMYHYNYTNFAYKLGIGLFILLILLSSTSFYLCAINNERTLNATVLRINLILSYMILVFAYDCSLYFNPTWAEAVTDFMHNAINKSLTKNILIPDAEYLPLFQRLISVFCFKILNLSPYVGLFVIQILGYFISGWIFSFFIKKEFSNVLDVKFRYMLCLLLMILVISKETGAFINFITYGIFIIFLYFVLDSDKWSKAEFVFFCIWGCLSCLSKGVYVTIFPYFVVCLILFYKNFSKRDKVFITVCSLASFLQLIFYLQVATDRWIDATNSSNTEHYYLKLLLEIFIDTPNRLLEVFTDKISIFDGISLPIIAVFWGTFIYYFIKEVIYKYIRKENINRNSQLIFMMIIYIMAQSLFLRITVYGINVHDIISDEFWEFNNYGIDNRYQILIFAAISVGFIILMQIIRKSKWKNANYVAFIILTICICIANPRLQLKGMGNDNYSGNTSLMADMTTEAFLLKDLEETKCRIVPIQPNHWTYTKNALCYCFGTNVFDWFNRVTTIASTEPSAGNLVLSNYPNVNTNANIWQVFIKKSNLINNSNYQIVLYDSLGNILLKQKQDNTKYQKLTSFTFESGINNISRIQIIDNEGGQVYIENAMYIVTSEESEFFN